LCLSEDGKQDGGEDGDNCDDDEKLDQGKGVLHTLMINL
jgi:hypothetical protein